MADGHEPRKSRFNEFQETCIVAKQGLTLREKFGYGLGDMASNTVYQAVINVLMYFYTDVYGIEAAAAGHSGRASHRPFTRPYPSPFSASCRRPILRIWLRCETRPVKPSS